MMSEENVKQDAEQVGEVGGLSVLGMTATYSPEDNKLRLYSLTRLDKEVYERVKAEGFRWAPSQKLFVAPMWTPSRADLLIELCGEIGDEDTSLVDRAEERADRFENYSEKRADDAKAAKGAVERITSGIPMGQPILVGHHSEQHARKDAERIENGMKRAVKMWETSQYWERRAAGALHHAKYKELPGVRHRRIKGLEADQRKQMKTIERANSFNKLWLQEGLTIEMATKIANFDSIRIFSETDRYGESLWSLLDKGKITAEEAAERAIRAHNATIDYAHRWYAHFTNRIKYERAMLNETGGIVADKFKIEVGGKVLCSGWRRSKGYVPVLRVNRVNGAITSVRTSEGVASIEEIEDYREPEAGDAEKVKAATKLAPLVNYPGEGFRHMTKETFDKGKRASDFYHVKKIAASDKYGAHRLRHAVKEGGPYYNLVGVYITDAKRVDPPAPSTTERPTLPAREPAPPREPVQRQARERTEFDDMKDQLKHGVKVVSAPQLFPTPEALAERMVDLADVRTFHRVLEPSAGTGNILREIKKAGATKVLAIEINQLLANQLGVTPDVMCANFLALTADNIDTFDRIVMNPPFERGQDVEHVTHAFELLASGGVLVSVMSAGVKFRSDKKTTAFRALVDEHGEMEDLPEDTFKESGTGVRTVLVTLRK